MGFANNAAIKAAESVTQVPFLSLVRKDSTLAPDLFKLYFDGRAYPFSRAKEAAFGIKFDGLAREKGMRPVTISNAAKVDYHTTVKVMSGLFKAEDIRVEAIVRIATTLGTNVHSLCILDHIQMISNAGENDPGKGLVHELIYRDKIVNPDRYALSKIIGSALRIARNPDYNSVNSNTISRKELGEQSGVGMEFITFLEHWSVPGESLEPYASKLAKSLGISVNNLLKEGEHLLEYVTATTKAKTEVQLNKDVKAFIVDLYWRNKYGRVAAAH